MSGLRVGWRVFGLGVIAMGVVGWAIGGFLPGQPAPKALPDRVALGYAAAVFQIVAGAALQWRRVAAWAAGAVTAYFAVIVVGVFDVGVVLRHPTEYGAYSGIAEQLAIAASGLIVFARFAPIEPALAQRLVRIGQVAFGICAVFFGIAHFVYMGLTAPIVPKWLPPGGVFWGYATGVFHIAGGAAILIRFRDRLAAILLTVMYAAFTPLVHLPMLLATPGDHFIWSENATNLVLVGVAWVVADSLGRAKADA